MNRRHGGAIAVVALLVYGFLGQLLPALVLGVRSDEQLAAALPIILMFSPLAAAVCVLLARRLGELPRPPHRPESARVSVATALEAGVVALAGSLLIAALQAHFFGVHVAEQSVIVAALRSPARRVLLALGIAVLVPIGEELVFRRLGFAALRERRGRLAAYAWSVVVFSAVHLNVSGALLYAWIGFVTALAYERTGRVSVAVFVHSMNNAIALMG